MQGGDESPVVIQTAPARGRRSIRDWVHGAPSDDEAASANPALGADPRPQPEIGAAARIPAERAKLAELHEESFTSADTSRNTGAACARTSGLRTRRSAELARILLESSLRPFAGPS